MKTIQFVVEGGKIRSSVYHPDLGLKGCSNMGKPMMGKEEFTNEFSSRNGDEVDYLLPTCCTESVWDEKDEKLGGIFEKKLCSCKPNGIRYCKCSPIDRVTLCDKLGSDICQLTTSVNAVKEIVPLIDNEGNGFVLDEAKSKIQVMPVVVDQGDKITRRAQSTSDILEVIPLTYSPRTKQLHIISVEGENNIENNMPPSPDSVFINGNRALESIEEGSEGNEDGDHLGDQSGEVKFDKQDNVSYESPRNTLQRVATWASLSRTDASSFSSISSLSTNADSSTPAAASISGEDGAQENLQNEISVDDRIKSDESRDGDDKNGAKPKSNGIAKFLSRNLFNWKSKDVSPPLSPPSWRLFNKTTPSQGSEKIEHINGKETELCEGECGITNLQDLDKLKSVSNGSRSNRGKRNFCYNPSSTTALILENRPLNLPAKPADEEMRHRHQYEQMIEAMKKRELKEAKLKKRLLQQQLKNEELIVQATRVWNSEILPNWETMKSSRKARDLWWLGIPPAVRGKVWKLAIGNELNITSELYEICVNRAQHRIRMASESASMSEDESEDSSPDKENSVELIKLDVSRTFPQLCIFQKGGPYYDLLHSLLGAYVCYRPDIGYLQGMSFLAAVLILNLEVDDAFICFANLLNKPCQLAFFRLVEPMMKSYFKTFEEYFLENLPKLFHHFKSQNVAPDLYLIDWIYTLYSKSLPLDVASRVWDVFFRDGEEFLFQTALGILHLYEDVLLHLDFIHVAQFLTKLPDDIIGADLFHSIESIRMSIDKKHFTQVLAFHSEPTDT